MLMAHSSLTRPSSPRAAAAAHDRVCIRCSWPSYRLPPAALTEAARKDVRAKAVPVPPVATVRARREGATPFPGVRAPPMEAGATPYPQPVRGSHPRPLLGDARVGGGGPASACG